MFELIFLKILLQISISLLHLVPKSKVRKLEEKYNFDILSFYTSYTRKNRIFYTAKPLVVLNPQRSHKWKSIDTTLRNNDLHTLAKTTDYKKTSIRIRTDTLQTRTTDCSRPQTAPNCNKLMLNSAEPA